MGKISQAREAGENAIKIDPNFAEAHNNLGSVYLDQSMTEKAVASFQRCLDLEPDNERSTSFLDTTEQGQCSRMRTLLP